MGLFRKPCNCLLRKSQSCYDCEHKMDCPEPSFIRGSDGQPLNKLVQLPKQFTTAIVSSSAASMTVLHLGIPRNPFPRYRYHGFWGGEDRSAQWSRENLNFNAAMHKFLPGRNAKQMCLKCYKCRSHDCKTRDTKYHRSLASKACSLNARIVDRVSIQFRKWGAIYINIWGYPDSPTLCSSKINPRLIYLGTGSSQLLVQVYSIFAHGIRH